tara:strand:+ start:1438 stop:2058 length:621 start_codon:yes stop_codon:yes gene_type:complete
MAGLIQGLADRAEARKKKVAEWRMRTPNMSHLGFQGAFAEARKAGVKTFFWHGTEYTTRLADEEPAARKVYVIGSLRNPRIQVIAQELREHLECEVFDDWYAAGPEADDYWKAYEQARGRSYPQALQGHAAKNVFKFDRTHLEAATDVVLVAPAGKSGHLEFGWAAGKGKRAFYHFPDQDEERWDVMLQFATGVSVGMEQLLEQMS